MRTTINIEPFGECMDCGCKMIPVMVDMILVGWVHRPVEDINGRIIPNLCPDHIEENLIKMIEDNVALGNPVGRKADYVKPKDVDYVHPDHMDYEPVRELYEQQVSKQHEPADRAVSKKGQWKLF